MGSGQSLAVEFSAPDLSKIPPLPPSPLTADLISRGILFTPTETKEKYLAARTGDLTISWNYDAMGLPIAIARPSTVDELCEIVKYHNKVTHPAGIRLCVACGRHSHQFMVDGTLAIDLCLLKGARAIDLAPGEVGVDGSVGYLECSGGSVLGEVDEAGRARGWVTTVGHVGSTGAGGLILQGGHGFLERKLGLSVDLLVEVDIVLASGELVTASETSHSHEDLFWAVRGGGGNFGIVTRFKLRAFELPKVILGGARIHAPLSMGWFPDRPELIKKWAALFDEKSDNSATGMLVLPCGGPVVEGLVYLGDPEEGKRVFAAHRKSVGFPLKDGVKPCSYYDDVQKFAPAHRGNFYNTGFMVPEITAEFADALAELALKANAPGSNTACALVVIPSSGKASTPAPGKTCVGTRDCRFWVLVVAEWKGLRGSPQAEDAKVRAMRWIDTVKARLSPLVNGKSYGVLGDVASHGEHKQERKYNRDVYGEFLPRLREIKTKYDPKNIFQINDNIQPLV